jgi:hypothetical protein
MLACASGVPRWNCGCRGSIFMPRHPFTTDMPEDLRRQAAEAVDRALKRVADHGDIDST